MIKLALFTPDWALIGIYEIQWSHAVPPESLWCGGEVYAYRPKCELPPGASFGYQVVYHFDGELRDVTN